MAVLLASLLAACGTQNTAAPEARTGSYADFVGSGARFAVEAGDVFGEAAQDIFGAAEADITLYPSMADMLEAVRTGRVDGALLGHSYVRQLQDSGMYPDFEYLWVPKEVYVNEAAPIFYTEELRDIYNEWFRTPEAQAQWEEALDRWIGVPLPAEEDIPRFEFTGENGVLTAANTGDYPPLVYFDSSGEIVGFEIEMISLFAQHLGKKLEVPTMAYEGILPYVLSGKADMSSCGISITDERMEGVFFGDPLTVVQAVLIVRKEGPAEGRDYRWFSGKKIANITGTLTYLTTEKIGAEPVYYNDSSSAAEDVRNGRVDGFMSALSAVRVMALQPGNEVFEAIAVPTEFFSAEVGGISMDEDVLTSFNGFLAGVRADGTLDDMKDRWFGDRLDLDAPLKEIPNTGENGVLKIATCSDSLPYAFVGAGGMLNGFSVELGLRYGAYLGKAVEFTDMEFGALIPYIVSGKADISIANMAITEERKESVSFTDPIIEEQHGILALKLEYGAETVSGGFIDWLKTGIERNLITDNRWKMIVDGLGVTLLISILSQVFGTVLGCFVTFVLLRKNRIASGAGRVYCAIINGTPIVVLLLITYYIIFGNTNISNILVAVAAFTIVTGANVGQVLKGAIETVDPVEIEAARSVGFTAFQAFLTVTLPQAVRRAMPAYMNGFVELVKATAIVGFIAIQDLTRAGDIIRSRTYDAFFPLIFVAIIYLIVTLTCVWGFKKLIKKYSGGM